MLDPVNRFSYGYLITPIVEMYSELELFRKLNTKTFIKQKQLIDILEIKPDYIPFIINSLESLSWVEKQEDKYLFKADYIKDLSSLNLTRFYSIEPKLLLTNKENSTLVMEGLKKAFLDSQKQSLFIQNILQAVIIVPLVIALRTLDQKTFPKKLSELDPKLSGAIETVFILQGWMSKKSKELTKNGLEILNNQLFEKTSFFRETLLEVKDIIGSADSTDKKISIFRLNEIGFLLRRLPNESYISGIEGIVKLILKETGNCQIKEFSLRVRIADVLILRKLHSPICEAFSIDQTDKTDIELPLSFHDLNETMNNILNTSTPEKSSLLIDGGVNKRLLINRNNQCDHFLEVLLNSQASKNTSLSKQKNVNLLVAWQKIISDYKKPENDLSFLLYVEHPVFLETDRISNKVEKNTKFEQLSTLLNERLISAEAFMLIAAKEGFFNQKTPLRYPISAPYCCASIHHLEKRDYQIRFASFEDLPALYQLEEICWKHLKSSNKQIRKRVETYPEGQFVLEKSGKVVGVIYSQRISDISDLDQCSSENVYKLHNGTGSIIQLLAVNVFPEFQNQNLGDQLLEFMLQRCSLINGVNQVVAVTLCKEFSVERQVSFEEYIHLRDKQGTLIDPVLSFHDSHGAEIVKALPGYRKRDKVNKTNGVLVHYDIHNRVFKLEERASKTNNIIEKKVATELPLASDVDLFVKEIVQKALTSNSAQFGLDIPLMEMGIESASLLKLTRQISENFNITLKPAFFFEYNTTKKVINYLHTKFSSSTKDKPTQENSGSNDNRSLAVNDFEDIAIVGTACRLPGKCNSAEELWTLLSNNESGIKKLSENRFNWPIEINSSVYPGINLGGFIEDIDCFDAEFFRILPKEAKSLDPQQRFMLELAWHCIEDSGLSADKLNQSETGVFIGASGSDYSKLMQEELVEVDAYCATGNSMAILANRISYFFDFSGPSIQLDTACSSSLTAVHSAIQSIRLGECQQALVGGVHLICHPANSLAYHNAGMLSPDGQCKTFDATANGYVRSEGAVMLFLKPLSLALKNSDTVHALLKGSAVNHGGLSGGLTVPSPVKQSQLLCKAWKNAGIEATDITYLEAHGTGTPLGDPIEIQGIKDAFNLSSKDKNSHDTVCGIGSIKSNLGHLEAAAGITGLLKIVLSMQNRELPASINFLKINPQIQIDSSNLKVIDKNQPWSISAEKKRIAGVSSFGSGGANAHVVLEEWIPEEKTHNDNVVNLFVISAKNLKKLREYAQTILDWIRLESNNTEFEKFLYTCQVSRYSMEERLAIEVMDYTDLEFQLTHWLENQNTTNTLWQKNVNRADEKELLLDETAINVQIEKALSEIAAIWVSGGNISFESFYSAPAERASIPLYPFSKDKYWFSRSTSDKQEHFLLGEAIFSPYGKAFSKIWEYLPSHFVFTQSDFSCPSIGFILELMVAAGKESSSNKELISIRNFEFHPYEIISKDRHVYETHCFRQANELVVEIVLIEGIEQTLIAEGKLELSEVNENGLTIENADVANEWSIIEDNVYENLHFPVEATKSTLPLLLLSDQATIKSSKIDLFTMNKSEKTFKILIHAGNLSIVSEKEQPILSIYKSES